MATYCLKRKIFVSWNGASAVGNLSYAGPSPSQKLSPAPVHPQNISSNGNMNVFNAGKRVGQNSVGAFGGLKNTWKNSGTLGKAGMISAGVGTGYLLGKGLGLWGNKKE